MGIPFYFKKITSEFSNIVVDRLPYHKCHRLFLDFNCGIHYCVGKIREREENKRIHDPHRRLLSHREFEDQLMEECEHLIVDLVSSSNPSTLVFVSIDGIPPMAKIAQQRKRRYFSDWKRRLLLERLQNHPELSKKVKYEWNSNAVTPGTVFMDRLMRSLSTFCS